MECIDASVAVKWFKADEENVKEAYGLYERIRRGEADYAVNEWLALEVVRGLLKANVPKENALKAYGIIKRMFSSGILLRITVSEVIELAKDLETELNLHAADAVHLATALSTGSETLWTEDAHLHKAGVRKYCWKRGLEIRRLG